MIYFDQAASSFPKAPGVAEAMAEAVNEYAANPGRSGHALSQRANAVIEETRKKLRNMFSHHSTDKVIFTVNATAALTQAIEGLTWQAGDEVIATVFEHNSVRRPLERLKEEKGITIHYIHGSEQTKSWTDEITAKLNDRTKLVIVSHGSNVTGEIIPIEAIGGLLKSHNTLFCVDASQTAGILNINTEKMGIDLLAFPGHKGLLGPQGTGVLMAGKNVTLRPVHTGGTGSASEERMQPDIWPAGWESGTLNTPGIAGLLKGLEEVEKQGLESIYDHEKKLAQRCIEGLTRIPGVEIAGPGADEERLGVVSFSIEGVDSAEIAIILDQHYGVAVRGGLHCAPMTHKFLGSADSGLVRASFGLYNTEAETDTFIQAVSEIADSFTE